MTDVELPLIVSVDDHVVEPPDVFEHHLPAKYKDIAPRVEHREDGTDAWKFLDFHIPNVGLTAVTGRPPEAYGMDPTSFDELRKGTYDVRERVLDMSANGLLGSLNFPSLPGFAGRLFGQLEDKDAALIELRERMSVALSEGKQRLADIEDQARLLKDTAGRAADQFVRENPWTAVGASAAIGLILGSWLASDGRE